jgi:hypothetical protein
MILQFPFVDVIERELTRMSSLPPRPFISSSLLSLLVPRFPSCESSLRADRAILVDAGGRRAAAMRFGDSRIQVLVRRSAVGLVFAVYEKALEAGLVAGHEASLGARAGHGSCGRATCGVVLIGSLGLAEG